MGAAGSRYTLPSILGVLALGGPFATRAEVAVDPGSPVQAPSPDEAGAVAANALPVVVVTANRFAQPLDQVGQSVTVLTLPQIRLDQETSVADILVRTPGLNLARNGGPGQTTSLYIRGAEAAQTVVLIDGVKINDPTDPAAGYDFANLLTGDVSRIEVLRGPQSTLYGSEAIGGVVNVITADAVKPLEGDAQIEGGSYGTAYLKGGVGGKGDRYAFRIGAFYNTSDSVSAFDKAFGGKEADGFKSAGLSGRLRYDLTPDLQIDERLYYTFNRTEFDGYGSPACYNFLPTCAFGDDAEFSRTQQFVDYTALNLSLLDGRLKNRFAFEYAGLDRRQEDPEQPQTKYTFIAQGRAYTGEYEGSFAFAPGYLGVFGAATERSSINAQAPYYILNYGDLPTKANVTETSAYGQITGEVVSGLTLAAGVRYDDNSTFGDHITGQASGAYKIGGGDTVLRASFGQGFKAPSLYQLYSEYGNQALRPEEADGWDAGVEQHFLGGRVVAQATYFGRMTKNLIGFVSCYDVLVGGCAAHQLFGGYYDNVAKAEAEGVELDAHWTVAKGFDLGANYTYDDVEDRSPGSPNKGLQLARRPRNSANITASYVWPIALKTSLAVRYAGESYDDNAHLVRLKSYTLVDLRASYPLQENLEIYARVENLADQHYETAYRYGTLGRAAYGGVRLSF
jgi:vitamin B12 transporter